jgi:hypothetical protein
MWRCVLAAAAWLFLAAPAGAATPVSVGSGPGGLLALGARDGVAYAVLGNASTAKPFVLVRSPGAPRVAFGQPGAANPDVDAGAAGVFVTWTRPISSAFELNLAGPDDLAHPQAVADGTGPPQVDAQGSAPQLAYTDEAGDVVYGTRTLTADAPDHRHLPLDAADGLVLDLDQRRGGTRLRVLGDGAPTQPIVSLRGVEGLEGSLAADAGHAYVAFSRNGRVFLATAARSPQARWSVRMLAAGTAGRPAIARTPAHTYVAYARGGAVRLDGRTLGPGSRPLLAADGSRVVIGWTRGRSARLARAG